MALLLLHTAAGPVSGAPASHAPELMLRLEKEYRQAPRVVRLEIVTEYDRRETERETLWGLFCPGAARLRILYVFTDPPTMDGSSLLLDIGLTGDEPDSVRLYLASLQVEQTLEESREGYTIPGMGLTYADARGYLPVSWYDFRPVGGGPESGADSLVLSARPRSTRIRERIGYDSLRVVVDPSRLQIRRIVYWDSDPRPLKTYEIVSWTRAGGVWLPREAVMRQHRAGFVSRMRFAYWSPDHLPGPELLRDRGEGCRARLEAYLRREGIAPRAAEEFDRGRGAPAGKVTLLR
jgi:hypothetical protein